MKNTETDNKTTNINITRRRSESAYIRQVNFVRNNGPKRYWDHDLDLSWSRDVIDDVIIRSAIGHFLLVVNSKADGKRKTRYNRVKLSERCIR